MGIASSLSLLAMTTLFHVNRLQPEFLACDDLRTNSMALRADQFLVGGMIFLEAGHTLQFGGDAAKVQGGFFRDGVLGDDLPIKLNGVIHHTGKLAHDDVQVRDAFGISLFSVLEGNF